MSQVTHQTHIPPTLMQRLFVWRMSRINGLLFLVLSAICVLNLNGILRLTLNISRAASLLILLAAVGCILTSRVRPDRALGRPGLLFFGFLVSFLAWGSVMGLDNPTIFAEFQLYFASTVVVLASAFAGYRLAQSHNLNGFLLVFFMIWLIATSSILFSDLFRGFTDASQFAQDRDSGFFANPNQAGSVATITFGIGFALLRGGRYTPFLLFGMGIAVLGALRTFSKMSILTILAVTIFQLMQSATSHRNRIRILLFSVMIIVAFSWLLTVGLTLFDWRSNQLERLLELRSIIVDQEINDETTTSRTFLLKVGWDKFLKTPFLGQGLGSFHAMPEAMGWGTHNTYLMVAGEAGIFIFLVLALFMSRWALDAYEAKDIVTRQVLLNYILIFSVQCLASHNMLNHRFHNIMMGLSFGLLAGRPIYMARLEQWRAEMKQRKEEEAQRKEEEAEAEALAAAMAQA